MNCCVWCKQENNDTVEEHIIPDSLGCPRNLIFRNGEVCGSCNNQLAHIDQSLCADFEITKFMFGIPAKGGRHPAISSRGNLIGKYINGAPDLNVNMDRTPVTHHDGTRIGAYGKSPKNVMATFKKMGEQAQITITQNGIINELKSIRAVHKIALESVAHFHGTAAALDCRFDPVRKYVLRGIGDRRILLMYPEDPKVYRHEVHIGADSEGIPCVALLRLACINVAVDLTPTQEAIPRFEDACRKLYGDRWTWAPID
jgi:hypothetical protein